MNRAATSYNTAFFFNRLSLDHAHLNHVLFPVSSPAWVPASCRVHSHKWRQQHVQQWQTNRGNNLSSVRKLAWGELISWLLQCSVWILYMHTRTYEACIHQGVSLRFMKIRNPAALWFIRSGEPVLYSLTLVKQAPAVTNLRDKRNERVDFSGKWKGRK